MSGSAKVQEIRRIGVKKVEFSVTLHESWATANHISYSLWISVTYVPVVM